jgi:predicted DNA binding CopG/RHH family protein
MRRRKIKSYQKNLNSEEKELLASFEKDEWRTIKNVEKEKALTRKAAIRSLRKDVRINIRLSSNDISIIKQIAAYEGLPYQTLIASILHKYAAGHLDLNCE